MNELRVNRSNYLLLRRSKSAISVIAGRKFQRLWRNFQKLKTKPSLMRGWGGGASGSFWTIENLTAFFWPNCPFPFLDRYLMFTFIPLGDYHIVVWWWNFFDGRTGSTCSQLSELNQQQLARDAWRKVILRRWKKEFLLLDSPGKAFRFEGENCCTLAERRSEI